MQLGDFLDQSRGLSESGAVKEWLPLAHTFLERSSDLELREIFDSEGVETQQSKAQSDAHPALLHHVGLTFFVPSLNESLAELHTEAEALFPENTRIFPSVLLKSTLGESRLSPEIAIFKSDTRGSRLSCEVLLIQTANLGPEERSLLQGKAGPPTHLAFDVQAPGGELHRGTTLCIHHGFERRTKTPVENPLEGLTSSYFDGTLASRPVRLELCYACPEPANSVER